MLIYDIETGPLPDDQIERHFKFTPPDPPAAEFDPSSVKYGNLKDEAKRAAKLEEARAAHAAALTDYPTTLAASREAAWLEFKAKAALSAATGRVLAVGVCNVAGKYSIVSDDADESAILSTFWAHCGKRRKDRIAGWNSNSFDLPFLIRRSWSLGVNIPAWVYSLSGKWVNFDQAFIDLRNIWLLGQSWGDAEASNLNSVSIALGGAGKSEGITGKDFARLWFGTPEEREQATAYLVNDLLATRDVAVKLGFV